MLNARVLEVTLGDRRVGTLANLTGDDNLFSFDPEYAEDPNRPVLSQAFIAANGALITRVPRTHRVAPPYFANLLPEEGSVLRSMAARQYQINLTRDFPFLRVLGADLPGAVITRDVSETPEDREQIAQRLAVDERPLRFSLAGIQTKFSATFVQKRLTIPMEGIGGSWIAKLPVNAFPRLPENEYHVMSLARAIGLDVPETHLISLDEIVGLPKNLPALRADEPRIAYVIRRFDRTECGRVHGEDFNQIADAKPEEKYDGKASHWIANVAQQICPPEDVEAVVRRLVFGVCIGDNDMHLKNWSVLYPNGRDARLSPVYDSVCTREYYPDGGLALTIGGERTFEQIDRAALERFARRAELPVRRTFILADEVITRLRDVWEQEKAAFHEPFVRAVERHFASVPLMSWR
ncbi:MAG: HipA domain-containing protein [Candidatus Eremiobacteraeota bacterium]|nr:HipA domain-containing protein [Candidatus Eremiobacteraeota bacterium]MBC5804536.1 HipA domain-containing protein [Candidatus Eremiobacteraeota bacterium]MBC5820978.1 HipA domain-containing protein [Candidatus Eremiobacteraeota bacterium]